MTYTHILASRLARLRAAAFTVITALTSAACADSSAPLATDEGVADQPAMSNIGTGCSSSYTRLVPVSTASQLTNATYYARPGDRIQLASGTYRGHWNLKTSGSAAARITLCGPRSAVLDGGGTSAAPITLAVRASNWTVQGFTIRNAFQGVFLIGAHGVIIKGLEISNMGQEAIHLHTFSTHNVIDSNYIHDTGKAGLRYGEGIYVGNASSKWCTYYNCQPDRTDYNQVTRNIIGPNIGAQMVDVKEGTTGTIISGNTFNGTGGSAYQDAWVNVYGNSSVMSGNRGTTARQHGIKVETLVSGWGKYNVFHSNSWNLTGAPGYGFRIGGGTPASTVDLGCDNTVTNADSGFATVPCSR